MTLSLALYLIAIVLIYGLATSRHSIGFLWVCLFVIGQLLLYRSTSIPVNTTIVICGLFFAGTMFVLTFLEKDPFSDTRVFRFLARVTNRAGAYLKRCGFKPETSLVDESSDARVRRLLLQLNAKKWHAVERQLSTADSALRGELIYALASVSPRPESYNNWVNARSESVLAYVVSGHQRLYHAWSIHGGGLPHTVSTSARQQFQLELTTAREDLQHALNISTDPAEIAHGLLSIAIGESQPVEKLWRQFARTVARDANHYFAHVDMLLALAEFRSGQVGEAFEFARTTASRCTIDSPLRSMIAVAHIEKWLQLDIEQRDHDRDLYFRQTHVIQELRSACTPLLASRSSDMGHLRALNTFCFCFYKGGQFREVRQLTELLDGRYFRYPWSYCGDSKMAIFDTGYAVDRMLERTAARLPDPLTV